MKPLKIILLINAVVSVVVYECVEAFLDDYLNYSVLVVRLNKKQKNPHIQKQLKYVFFKTTHYYLINFVKLFGMNGKKPLYILFLLNGVNSKFNDFIAAKHFTDGTQSFA